MSSHIYLIITGRKIKSQGQMYRVTRKLTKKLERIWLKNDEESVFFLREHNQINSINYHCISFYFLKSMFLNIKATSL